MKSLLLIILFVPLLSFGQRFEVSEQAGVSLYGSFPGEDIQATAFSNQATFGYNFMQHF